MHRSSLARSLLTGLLVVAASTALAAESATIQLTDGSTLRGEIRSLKGGSYEVATSSLGVVRIPQRDIVLVSYGNSAAPTAATEAATEANSTAAGSAADLASIQARLSSDPETLKAIMGLGQDPAVKALINDPEVQAAIASGNFAGLMDHPKIKALMRHPTVRKITRESTGTR